MKIQCNLDRRGRWLRVLLGAICVIGGVTAVRLTGQGLWYISSVIGVLILIEALIGWCLIRGLGFRTPF